MISTDVDLKNTRQSYVNLNILVIGFFFKFCLLKSKKLDPNVLLNVFILEISSQLIE